MLGLLVACSGPESGSGAATATVPSTATIASTPTTQQSAAATSTATIAEAPTQTTATTSLPGASTSTSTSTTVMATATATIAVTPPTATVVTEPAVCSVGVELLAYTDVLDGATYDDNDVGGLSALSWSREGTLYYALSDRSARVYTIDFAVPAEPEITGTFRLLDEAGEPDRSIDGEGIAVMPNGDLLVSSETIPSIRRYTPDGEFVADLPVPEHFLVDPAGRTKGNRAFESLALSPSGEYLYTAVEEPLAGDGFTDDDEGRIRILRYERSDGEYAPVAEYFYLSESHQDISEIAAISDDELLVMERGLSLVDGFSARVFRVPLDDAEDVSDIEFLEDADVSPVEKSLLVDVSDCPPGDLGMFGDINGLLDNFESMAIGPPQPDGRHTLIIGSDDDFETFFVTRYLIFAIDPPRF